MYLLVLDQKSNLLDFPALWQCCGAGFRGRTAGLVLRGKGGPRRLDTGIRLLAQNLFCTLDSVQGIGLVAQNLFYASGLLRRCCKVRHEPSAGMTTADFVLTRHTMLPVTGNIRQSTQPKCWHCIRHSEARRIPRERANKYMQNGSQHSVNATVNTTKTLGNPANSTRQSF